MFFYRFWHMNIPALAEQKQTSFRQLCADTGCRLEDISRPMANRDGWQLGENNAKILLYSHNHNIDLRTSMNELTHFFIKIYISHFILEKVDDSVVCERWAERHILRERTSSSHIFFRKPGGANAFTPLQAETPLIGCVSLAWLRFFALCLNLTAWFSSRGFLPVTHL